MGIGKYYLVLVEKKDIDGKNLVTVWKTEQQARLVGDRLINDGDFTKYRIYYSEDDSDYYKLKEINF